MIKTFIVTVILSSITLVSQAQDWAKARLEKSPRHLEFVKVEHDGRSVESFIAYPEIKDKATAVIVIHEIFGLSDWVRSVVDDLAEAGYIAIAPDLLSGLGPKGGGTSELGGADGARKVIGSLPAEQVTADLNALVDYVSKLPACNGKVIVAGFCWGGGQSFRFAANNRSLKAALVFYGQGPDKVDVARINCPIYGFYGGNDARIGAGIPQTVELMKAAGKTYQPVTYEGAGHGFMRAGDGPPPPADADAKVRDAYAGNKKARDAAWSRLKSVLAKL